MKNTIISTVNGLYTATVLEKDQGQLIISIKGNKTSSDLDLATRVTNQISTFLSTQIGAGILLPIEDSLSVNGEMTCQYSKQTI